MRSKSRGFAPGHLQRDLTGHVADKHPSESSGGHTWRDGDLFPGRAAGQIGGGADEEGRDDGLSPRVGQHTSQKSAGFTGRGDAQVQLIREDMFHLCFFGV